MLLCVSTCPWDLPGRRVCPLPHVVTCCFSSASQTSPVLTWLCLSASWAGKPEMPEERVGSHSFLLLGKATFSSLQLFPEDKLEVSSLPQLISMPLAAHVPLSGSECTRAKGAIINSSKICHFLMRSSEGFVWLIFCWFLFLSARVRLQFDAQVLRNLFDLRVI